MPGMINITNFLIDLIFVSALMGVLVLLLGFTKKLFKNRYTCFLKQLIWIVLAIRLIVPISYDNTLLKLKANIYSKDNLVTYYVESINDGIDDNLTYVAPFNADDGSDGYSSSDKEDYNEKVSSHLWFDINNIDEEQKENIDAWMSIYINAKWDDVLWYNMPLFFLLELGMKIECMFARFVNFMYQNAKLILTIYIAGVVLFLLYQIILYAILFYKKEHSSKLVMDKRYLNILNQIAVEVGLKKTPKLRFMRDIYSPMVVKFGCYEILLPWDFSDDNAPVLYTDNELRVIFRHELMHIKHHDIEIKWLYLIANAFHWFNPLIYKMIKNATGDMELYCDYSVVENFDKHNRIEYNQILLNVLKSHNSRERHCMLTTYFKGGADFIKERFISNIDMRKKKEGIIPILILIFVIIFSAGFFSVKTDYFPLPVYPALDNRF